MSEPLQPVPGLAAPARGRELLLATLFFAALTVALTWPVSAHWRTLIPVSAPPVDALCEYYALGWGLKALVTQPLHFFDAPYFYPYAGALAFMEHLFGLALLALPFKLATGSLTVAYNAVWLLTFVLSALGAYQLVRALSGSAAGAALAGVLYAFQPFRYHNAGQLNVLGMMWIPWALLCLHLWLAGRGRRYLVGLALLGALQFLSSAYAGVFLALAAAFYVVPALVLGRERGAVRARVVADGPLLALLAVGVAAITLPFALPYLRLARGGAGLHRSLGETVLYSAHPADFVTAAPHSLWRAASLWAGVAHHALFPGLVALALAHVGFWHSRRGERLFYGGLALAGAVLALGPRLLGVAARVPLPFAVAWFVVPGVSSIRAPVRFITLEALGLAVLAGFGVAWLSEWRSGGWWRRLAFVPALLAAVELCAAPVAQIDPSNGGLPRIYTRVRALPPDAVLAELPMAADEYGETVDDVYYQIWGLEHGRRLVNGVAASLPPKTRVLRRAVQTFPDEASLAALRALGVTHVVVHADRLPGGETDRLAAAVAGQPALRKLVEVDSTWLLEMTPGRRP